MSFMSFCLGARLDIGGGRWVLDVMGRFFL